jgi:hypothetical protein
MSLNSINWLALVSKMHCVSCEAETQLLYTLVNTIPTHALTIKTLIVLKYQVLKLVLINMHGENNINFYVS